MRIDRYLKAKRREQAGSRALRIAADGDQPRGLQFEKGVGGVEQQRFVVDGHEQLVGAPNRSDWPAASKMAATFPASIIFAYIPPKG